MTQSLSFALMFVLVLPSAACADRPEAEDVKTHRGLQEHPASGPYCGVKSVFACISSLGLETEFSTYVDPRFIGTYRGSSANELVQCAESHGVNAKVISHATENDLRRSAAPMVLHVRSPFGGLDYNHWISFLGIVEETAVVYDPASTRRSLTMAELLAQWDGTAVVVSFTPIDLVAIRLCSVLDNLLPILIACSAILWLRRGFASVFDRYRHPRHAITFLLTVSIACCVAIEAPSSTRLLRNPHIGLEIASMHSQRELPTVSFRTVFDIVNNRGGLLVDARFPADFRSGTIHGAINLPVNATLSEKQTILSRVSFRERIVVFCKSPNCEFADSVARFLVYNGFRDVAIYRAGYSDWLRQSNSAALKP